MDPTAILPPHSSLWKSSKVDIRKPSAMARPPYRDGPPSSHANPFSSLGSTRPPVNIPSRENATSITVPTNPPRSIPFAATNFVHPDTIGFTQSSSQGYEQPMSSKEAEEALKNFFESALEPEKDEEGTATDVDDEEASKVEGLHVKLMKHQVEGLEFLRDHECEDDKVKAKGKGIYGGILADDVSLLLTS
jgi:hypothetical protein